MKLVSGLLGVVAVAGSVAVGWLAPSGQLDDLTEEEARYFGAASTLSNMMGDSFRRVTPLTENPRLQDLDWQNDFLGETAVWKAIYQQAQELEPPERLESLHEESLEAYEIYDQAADETRAALEALDPAAIGVAALTVQAGNEALQEATDELADLQDE